MKLVFYYIIFQDVSFVTRELKPYFERTISPLVEFLARQRVNPNLITISGLIFVFAGSVFLYYKLYIPAFILLLIGALLDAIDGAVARRLDLQTDFGAFLDSTVDRISDSLPFISLGVMYAKEGEPFGVFLSFTSLIGSFGVSYARARAEAIGIYGLGGIFERTERWIVLLIGVIANLIPLALLIITIGSFITVGQRIYEVWRATVRRF